MGRQILVQVLARCLGARLGQALGEIHLDIGDAVAGGTIELGKRRDL